MKSLFLAFLYDCALLFLGSLLHAWQKKCAKTSLVWEFALVWMIRHIFLQYRFPVLYSKTWVKEVTLGTTKNYSSSVENMKSKPPLAQLLLLLLLQISNSLVQVKNKLLKFNTILGSRVVTLEQKYLRDFNQVIDYY